MLELRRIGDAHPWREVFVAGGGKRLGNAGIAGDDQPGKCFRVECGVLSGNPGL